MQTTKISRQRTAATPSGSHPTVAEAVVMFLDYMARRDKSPRSIRTYGYVLDSYVEAFGGRDVTSVTLADVEGWVLRPRRNAVTNTTLRKDAVVVRGMHQWLLERGHHVAPLTTLKFGKLNRTTPRPVDDDVWLAMWSSDLSPLDRVWLGLGYFAGLRRLEMIQLQPDGVDLEARELLFQRKGGFHANVEYGACFDFVESRLPHLTAGVNWPMLFDDHVKQRRAVDANYVWPDTEGGDELDCNRLNKRCDRLTKNLGLPPGALTPHRLRHSCATNLLRCGVPIEIIQRQLAHSSIDITQRYLQMSGELARAYHGAHQRGGRGEREDR